MSEPSTAATNALVLEEAAQRGTHNPIHYDDKTTSSTAIATAAGEQNTSQEEKNPQLHKVYRGEEPQRQQLERQQPCQHKEQQQQQQQQQHQTKQQLPYPTRILSKPRQEAVCTITTSEPSSIANSCSSPVLPSTTATPHHTAVRTSVTPLRTDKSVLLTVDGADTAKPRLETTLNQGIASEQKKLTNNDDGSYKAPTNEPEQAKVNEQGKQNTTTGLSKGKEVIHKEKLKEAKREAPISGKSEDKISSPDEHLVSSKNDARDKDAGYSFSLPNKRNVTKPVAKHNSGKKKEHIQSFKKDDVSTKKSIIEPTEDEYDVTVRIVMPDGKEILQRATADKKKKPQKPSATATTTATSSTSHSPQSKYTIDEKVENTLISEPVKSLPKSAVGRHHGQQQFSEKKQLDSKLHLREGAVKSEKLDKESALKKQHPKESRMKRSSLQKNLQEEEQKTELPLPKHTDDSKSLQKLAQPLVEAEVEVKRESREVTSLTQAQEEQQPKEKVEVPKPPKTSLRKSMEETESMNKELPLNANAVTTMLHPSGKSVMFSRNKVGNKSRNSDASFQYQGRGRSSGGGRRGANTTAMVPKGTDQSQSVIDKINKDVPQSVAEASDVTERTEGHTIPKFGVTEKLERDSAAETLTLAKESQNGDGTTEQTSTSKSRKSHGKHIIRSAQMAHGGGRGRNIVHARGKRHFKPPHSTEH
jgi:hypothetical protein